MSFLFKKNKPTPQPPPSSLPQATRNIHTSDGTSTQAKPPMAPSMLSQPQIDDRKAQSPPPSIGANSSLDSLTISKSGPPPMQQQQQQQQQLVQPPSQQQVQQQTLPANSQAPFARRDRSGSELGARPPQSQMRPPPHADLYPWSQKPLAFQNPQANPFPRYGAAVNAIASKDGDIYLMGGLINGETVRGDLWLVEAGTGTGAPTGQLSCYPIATVSEGPGPRVGHASLLVGNAFIVFGGDTQQEDTDILDDTLYLLNTTSRQWSRASPPGRRPAGRYGHTLNILGSKIYIFGGQVEGAFYNDLIAFDLNALQNPNNQWEFLTPNTTGTSAAHLPPARTNHTMISHNDTLFLFGGTDGQQWFNDVWTFDPKANRWTMLDCIGYIPAPREGHSAALVNDVMYIFGGRTEHGDDLGDLAAFRISLRRWYTFQNMGPSPSPRSGHSMTAYGKQIIVVAGEPSTAPRDPAELSMAYILDTAKIRYPNDAPPSQSKLDKPSSPSPQSSDPLRNIGTANPRSVSRDGTAPVTRSESPGNVANSAVTSNIGALVNGGPVQRPDQQPLRGPPPSGSFQPLGSGPRLSMGPPPTGPPPQGQPPNPRQNGAITSNTALRGKTDPPPMDQNPRQMAPPIVEQQRQAPTPSIAPQISSLPMRTDSRNDARSAREPSPGSQGRRTPQSTTKAKAMEAGEAAPLVGAAVARQRSHRSQRAHASLDASEEGILRSVSNRSHNDHRHSRSFADEPHSPNITPHHEALMKELEVVKSKNAWYASELALARKSGYTASPTLTTDERATMNFADDDRPIVEAFMSMRSELLRMQQNMEQQSKLTAQKIGEVEHQRDAAITEAAYARAKLAAHGGSQRSTPQLGSMRDGDEADRSTDISRRLALSLAATNDHKAKLEVLANELEAERKAREAAEEAADAAQNRFDELSSSRNPGEIEGLKAELHDAENFARAEAGRRSELEQKLRMLEVDHKEISAKHADAATQVTGHLTTLAVLEAAIAASNTKAGTFERQLDDERQNRENVERKLATLRSDHEDRTQELESTARRLRDVEELADNHAREANTHREALMVGLAKISRPEPTLNRDASHEERVGALQFAVEEANKLVKVNETAAEVATQKLRSAEERIAGLEAYQEQSSREGLGIRRQLQVALRDLREYETHNRELKTQIESHQHNVSALSVQHGALKNLLGERGVDMSNARRSPGFDGGSRNGTPDIARTRDLEQQLQLSQRSHEESKMIHETQQQDAEKAYRERLEQLENDYQSLLTYVKGTEKMLKKMKEELTKYKTANQKLQTELETSADGKRSVNSNATDTTEWAGERDAMQSAINEMKMQMTSHIQTLENNMATVKLDLEKAQTERDQQMASHKALSKSIEKREQELTELKSVNSHLETRALDAEHRVTVLLDQVGSSVNQYRRESQIQMGGPNGVPGLRSLVGTTNHARAVSPSGHTDTSSAVGEHEDARGSVALDNLASELETLKAQWESQSRGYRLSDRFDFERTPTRNSHQVGNGTDLSHSIAQWRHEDNDDTPTIEKTQAATVSHPPATSSTLSGATAAAKTAVINAAV